MCSLYNRSVLRLEGIRRVFRQMASPVRTYSLVPLAELRQDLAASGLTNYHAYHDYQAMPI